MQLTEASPPLPPRAGLYLMVSYGPFLADSQHTPSGGHGWQVPLAAAAAQALSPLPSLARVRGNAPPLHTHTSGGGQRPTLADCVCAIQSRQSTPEQGMSAAAAHPQLAYYAAPTLAIVSRTCFMFGAALVGQAHPLIRRSRAPPTGAGEATISQPASQPPPPPRACLPHLQKLHC